MAEDGNGEGANGQPKKGGADDSKPGIQDWFLKTAATIIGGLGTAGAMVVIGSAVLGVRFREAGIPPVQAVSVQPKQEALVQGAQTTIVFILAALAVVVALYISDFRKEPEQDGDPDKRSDGEKRASDPDPGTKREIETGTKVLLSLLPIPAIAWLIFGTEIGCWWTLGLSLLALALTGACLWIGRSERKNFWALAAAVFVAIIVFSGAAGYAIVQQQKFVQAVAILRGEEDTGLTGYYVATTENKLYFANSVGAEGAVKPEGKPLQEVALNEEVTYSIGPLESQEDATARVSSMLRKLIADREGKVGRGSTASNVRLPAWADSDVAATFGSSVKARTETPESLCLMRYLKAGKGTQKAEWWTSCAEAEAQASINDARNRFALPRRFQEEYDQRVKVGVPAGIELKYVEGDTAPQCGGDPDESCGYRYPGGGLQYWIAEPTKLGEVVAECTSAPPDQDSAWHPCEG